MDHLLRVQRLAEECDKKETNTLQTISDIYDSLEVKIPEDSTDAQKDLLFCKV